MYAKEQAMWQYEKIYKEFETCRKEHINNEDVMHNLYRKGLTKQEFSTHLEHIVYPVYQSARDMGFREWAYNK